MTSRIYAYLSVSGFICAPDEVAAMVGLPVRRHRMAGELMPGGRVVAVNTWASQPVLPASEDQPDHHVAAVLAHIATRPPDLADFLRKHDSGINCVGEFRRINGGFHLSAERIAQCAGLGLWLDFDVYNYSVEDDS